MQPEKIDLASATISDEKLAQLRDLLPEVFHEGKINFDELKNALGEYVEDDPANERFGLRWPGKSKLQQVINTPSVGTLVPQPEESVDWDDTGNIIIEGDNLEVLKLLQKSYAGKVKMIYIDPPYNTGNDFVYPDKYASGLDTYLEFTGQTDEAGKKLASNSDTSGRYHANWLNMMYPRLYLARNLLRQDGVIFISVDDSEQANLQKVLVEVFGEDNFVASIAWEKRYTRSNNARSFYSLKDFVILFRRSDLLDTLKEPRTSKADDNYSNPDYGPKGPWMTSSYVNPAEKSRRPNLVYPIVSPDGRTVTHPTHAWKYGREEHEKHHTQNRLWWGRNGDAIYPRLKLYLSEAGGMVPVDVWSYKHVGSSDDGGREVETLFGGSSVFDNPKPIALIQKMMQIAAPEGGIILDFFAGSGTTGHAVMQQNAEDGGNRKYILVQLPEPMETKTLDGGTELNTIADITRERVRRAGRKIAEEHKRSGRDSSVSAGGPNSQNDRESASRRDSSTPEGSLNDGGLDIGFRAYRLAPSNFQPWDGDNISGGMMQSARQASFMPQNQQLSLEERILQAADHLSPAADDLAILTELLLKLGEELTVPVEKLTFSGKTVYAVDGNVRLLCLERDFTLDVIREMAAREPGEIICLDAGFPDDQTKVNAGQIIATRAQHMEGAIAFKVV